MLNKINQLMQWTINKLIKILTVVIFILGSTQSSAAWFVSDIALTDLAATLVSATEAAATDQVTANGFMKLQLPVPPLVLMPATLVVAKDAVVLSTAALAPDATISAFKTLQCIVVSFGGVKHPVDVLINTACLEMVTLRAAMIAAHKLYLAQMVTVAAVADTVGLAIASPTLGGATAQSLVIQKAQLTHSINSSMYEANMEYARSQMADLIEMVKVLNSRKIYGIF